MAVSDKFFHREEFETAPPVPCAVCGGRATGNCNACFLFPHCERCWNEQRCAHKLDCSAARGLGENAVLRAQGDPSALDFKKIFSPLPRRSVLSAVALLGQPGFLRQLSIAYRLPEGPPTAPPWLQQEFSRMKQTHGYTSFVEVLTCTGRPESHLHRVVRSSVGQTRLPISRVRNEHTKSCPRGKRCFPFEDLEILVTEDYRIRATFLENDRGRQAPFELVTAGGPVTRDDGEPNVVVIGDYVLFPHSDEKYLVFHRDATAPESGAKRRMPYPPLGEVYRINGMFCFASLDALVFVETGEPDACGGTPEPFGRSSAKLFVYERGALLILQEGELFDTYRVIGEAANTLELALVQHQPRPGARYVGEGMFAVHEVNTRWKLFAFCGKGERDVEIQEGPVCEFAGATCGACKESQGFPCEHRLKKIMSNVVAVYEFGVNRVTFLSRYNDGGITVRSVLLNIDPELPGASARAFGLNADIKLAVVEECNKDGQRHLTVLNVVEEGDGDRTYVLPEKKVSFNICDVAPIVENLW